MKVSVVVLTYNQEKTIARTLDSILKQKCSFDFEVIIGEDASPSDKTRKVCEGYAQKYHNLKLLPEAPNKGLMINYADCLKECQGEYIAVCAGDDWWHNENKLQIQVNYMDSHENCVLCYTNFDTYLAKNEKIRHNSLPVESLDSTGIIDKLLLGFFLPPLTAMYRREMLNYISLEELAQKGYMAEDLPMYLEMALHGDFHCINTSMATYKVEIGSISQFNSSEKMERFMLNMRDIKLDFLANHINITKVTAQQLEELYDRIIFNYAFNFCDSAMIKKYSDRIVGVSNVQRIKLLIFRFKPLFWIFKQYKKI